MLAYYSMVVTACRHLSYFCNPFLTSAAILINDKPRFVLFPSASSFVIYMPTQDFYLLQNVLLMDANAIMFSHKTDSILTYWLFKHQKNKISILVVWTLIFINLLTYGYRMTFQMPLW